MLACLLNLLAMASVNVCRLCTKINVEKTINLFSRAGMRNEWSSRISAMLDIMMKEFLHMCATSAHVDCHYRRRPLKIVSHSGSLAISSFNAQMKKRTRVASADIGISPDTVRLRPSAKLSRKRLVFECKYQNV